MAKCTESKVELATITRLTFDLQDQIMEGLKEDSFAKHLFTLPQYGKTTRFWVKDELMYTKGNRLFKMNW